MTRISPGVLAAVRDFVEGVATRYAALSLLTDADDIVARRAGFEVSRVPPGRSLPEHPVDVVVSFEAPGRVPRWEEYLQRLARLARKALVIVVTNDERIGAGGAVGLVRLAEVAWCVGRVREHVYLAMPRVLAPGGVAPAPAGRLVRRMARLHAFVVDTAPRSPQARRRLRTLRHEPDPS